MLSKQGQLAGIEFKYLLMGVLIGLIIGIVLVYLGTNGIIPFKIPLVCG